MVSVNPIKREPLVVVACCRTLNTDTDAIIIEIAHLNISHGYVGAR